jgi:hypothetical protein
MCISPILIAKVLGHKKPSITFGNVNGENEHRWPHFGAI